MLFSSTAIKPVVSNRHPWGCPVLVLIDKAQDENFSNWDPTSRVAIYLGHSPTHAGSVAMVFKPYNVTCITSVPYSFL